MSDKNEVTKAFEVLSEALKLEQDYAWSWHCNIAMSVYDAGCCRSLANKGAAAFMRLCFGVDTGQFDEYKSLMKQLNDSDA